MEDSSGRTHTVTTIQSCESPMVFMHETGCLVVPYSIDCIRRMYIYIRLFESATRNLQLRLQSPPLSSLRLQSTPLSSPFRPFLVMLLLRRFYKGLPMSETRVHVLEQMYLHFHVIYVFRFFITSVNVCFYQVTELVSKFDNER